MASLEQLKKEVKKTFDFSKYLKKSMSFDELKKWAINHLKKQLQDEDVAKSLYLTTLEVIQKAAYPVGTIREWKGKKYIKTAPGKWMRKYDNAGGRGYNQAIKNLMRKVEAAETPEQLYSLIKQNLRRFKDEKTGKILPEVKEIYAMAKNEKSSTGKLTETINSIGKKKGEVKKEEKKEDLPKKEEKINGKLPSGYVTDLSIEKQGELHKLLKEHFKKEGMSGMEIADALDNAMDSKISDLEEIYNNNKQIKQLLMSTDSDSSSFKLSDIYDRNVHDEMKQVESFDEAKNVIKQIADNYGPSEKGRKLLFNFMAYNVGGSNPIYDKLYDNYKVSYNDLDNNMDAAYNKILKLAKGDTNVKQEEKQIKQGADDFAARYRAGIEAEDREYIKQEKANQTKEHNLKTPKKNIGEVINKGNETVEIPSNKQARLEIDQLKKTASKEEIRENLKHVYYEDGKLIATNGRILKTVQVGDLGDIPDGSYVEIDTKGKNIVIKKMNGDGMRFPNWKRVMPESNTKKASINGKVLQEKIKEMEKNGSFLKSKMEDPIVRLEIKNGEITLDGTVVGKTNDLKDTNIQFNKDYLKNVITDNDFTLMMSDKDTETRGMSISNETSDNVIMPLHNNDRLSTDYANNRKANAKTKEEKRDRTRAKEEANYKSSKDFYDMAAKGYDNLSPKAENLYQTVIKQASKEQLENMIKLAKVDVEDVMKKHDMSNYGQFYKWTKKNYGVSQYDFAKYTMMFQHNNNLANALYDEAQKRGISIKKSFSEEIQDILKSLKK